MTHHMFGIAAYSAPHSATTAIPSDEGEEPALVVDEPAHHRRQDEDRQGERDE